MDRTLLLATAAVMLATMAQADGTYGTVSSRTLGASISSDLQELQSPGQPNQPGDPYQPGVVQTTRTELPPNPIFPADQGPGPDGPFAGTGN